MHPQSTKIQTTRPISISEMSVSSVPYDASTRLLTLQYGALEASLSVPAAHIFHAEQLKGRFTATLAAAIDGLAQDHEPASAPELVAKYLEYITDQVERHEENVMGSSREILKVVLSEFQHIFLKNNDIHVLAASISSVAAKFAVIRSYYRATEAVGRTINSTSSALFLAAKNGSATIHTIFGGQGNTEDYFNELREVYRLYKPFISGLIVEAAELLQILSKSIGAHELFFKGLDILAWLEDETATPDVNYLIKAPISFPLIGLIQLAHYEVTCKILGIHPGLMREYIQGTTGHSQGIVLAAVTAAADSWGSWKKITSTALTILFWIGVRSQQVFPHTSVIPSARQISEDNDEGSPSPMLSVRGLSASQVQTHIDATNQYLSTDRHISISLFNGPRNSVVAGPPASLCGLNAHLRKAKAPNDQNQNRIPHGQRKTRFINRFLPISAPFHSNHLLDAVPLIDEDLENVQIPSNSLGFPVINTHTGKDIREEINGNIVPTLVRLIIRDAVNWEEATAFPRATHILDFGPGGALGLGVLTSRNKEGTGVHTILAGSVGDTTNEVGYKHELFDRDEEDGVTYAIDWVKEFGPRLVKATSTGKTYVDTKLSRFLGIPPLIVAGMTPSTVPWDFVAATMNAGYHIELAGGGYRNVKTMTEAFAKLEHSIPAGRGIAINLIYANPAAISWQISLIGRLRAEGVPIEALTIGAGVPSIEVAQKYIDTLDLRYISFKPGSVDGIEAVIKIAKTRPQFPIVLQWTGGRGGGHHSYEDFHQPILATYGYIRQQKNIFLVAGGGFGAAEDTYPYLIGKWSKQYGYPEMPFDGFLFGSRMMVAKEAHTSQEAKQAIVDAPGVGDDEWEKTYHGSTGGVISVRSEMGEPIHKLATRGVLLWAEMEKKIFSLPKQKRLSELKKSRNYIIRRLNDDFQKVWFGRKETGEACDVEDMTYGQVARRLVDLLYVRHESRWIDTSYTTLTADFLQRIEERFNACRKPFIKSHLDFNLPYEAVTKILHRYPKADTQLINAQDTQFFMMLSMRRGMKPVNFIPALDENFEHYFKKDSLWQSEDVSAVYGQDIGRTCILQGPVAVRYSQVVDEPIKSILDSISNGHIELLAKESYQGDQRGIPTIGCFSGKVMESETPAEAVDSITVSYDGSHKTTYSLSTSPSAIMPSTESWLSMLAGLEGSWRHALLTSKVLVQDKKFRANPMKLILAPFHGLSVEVHSPMDPATTKIIAKEPSQDHQYVTIIEVKLEGKNEIVVNMIAHSTALDKPLSLPLKFIYHAEAGYAPIHENMEDRNDRVREFYWRAWFGQEMPNLNADISSTFDGGEVIISDSDIAEFVHAVSNTNDAYVGRSGRTAYAPMDFSIVVAWKAIMKPIFVGAIDADILKLVHLSNEYRMTPGAEPLKKGDKVYTTSQINAIINQSSGKMVEVCGTIHRDGEAIMDVVSTFLYRGVYNDYTNTFQRKMETPRQLHLISNKDVAILKSKQWFILDDDYENFNLVGQVLNFHLQTFLRFKSEKIFSSIHTQGQVFLTLPNKETVQIARIRYEAGQSNGNPVIDYLERLGSHLDQAVLFENPIPLTSRSISLRLRAPVSNEKYARISGDWNPIHISRVFASYADLPGTITHGMHSSAAVRGLLENWAADNNVRSIRRFHASFVGMVLPSDNIEVKFQHIGMLSGRRIIKVEARTSDTSQTVLLGEAEVEQPLTAYIFTGQGSQSQGMGMDLYASSPAAQRVWDRADAYFLATYGTSTFAILEDVKYSNHV